MKAFVITLIDNLYSMKKSERCIKTARDIGKIEVDRYHAIDKKISLSVLDGFGLEWTWANNNKTPSVCPITGLKQKPYYDANLDSKVGCALSHFLLWKHCAITNEPILILEHDAVFIREFPSFDFKGICQINDPKGGGKNGRRLSEKLVKQNKHGVQPKTSNSNDPLVPDGLAGNSAYVIKPYAAQELIDKYHQLGVWPNDATMCIQLFPYLEEYYPFITKVEQDMSTSSI